MYKYKTICVGIDQSYKRTGISISADGKLLKINSIDLNKYENNSQKRSALKKKLNEMLLHIIGKSSEIICIIERIRLQSKGFLNINYIKSIGALNALIVDVMYKYSIPVYSVDTRCWKAQVIGTSKSENNKYGVQPEKWPTIKWVISKGFENSILIMMDGSKKSKGIFYKFGKKYCYNDDAADSAAISMFYFIGKIDKLQLEH